MGRKILAVICGYAAMFMLVFVTFTIAFLAIGVEGSYKPGSYESSTLWCIVSLILGGGAAWVGGWMCGRISRSMTTVYWLVGVVLVMGVFVAVMTIITPVPTELRPAQVDPMTAMQKSITPLWMLIVNPIIGALGALMGGRAGAPRDSAAQTAPPSPH